MSSLLSTSDKNTINQIFTDLHDTFARTVTYFKENNIVTISSDANYNYVYGDNDTTVTTTTSISSGTFNARIHHLDFTQKNYKNYTENDIPLPIDRAFVRLKVDVTGKNVLLNTKQIILDNTKFEPYSAIRPLGPFSPNYYAMVLKEIK